MKFCLPVLAITIATLALRVPPAEAQGLPDASACELALEKAASQCIFDLKLELGRTNALSSNEFTSIRTSLDALLNIGTSSKARACFSHFLVQKQRYQEWFQQQAGEVQREAQKRLDRSCSRHTDMFIRTHRNRIDSALRKKKLATAATLATQMQEGIETDSMIRDCPAMQDRLGIILKYYVPEIQNQAALPQVLARLETAYLGAQKTLDEVNNALNTKGRSMRLAPTALESGAGQDTLRADIKQCADSAKTLREIGAKFDTILSTTPVTAMQAVAFCADAAPALSETFARVARHNAAFRAADLARWRRTQLKSWSMEKLFNANGRPAGESTTPGGLTIWTYQSEDGECLQYRFSGAGKRLDEHALACPVLSVK